VVMPPTTTTGTETTTTTPTTTTTSPPTSTTTPTSPLPPEGIDPLVALILGVGIGGAAVILIVAIGKLFRHSTPRLTPPTQTDVDKARTIIAASPDTVANLALLGDKTLLFNDKINAFIMYAVEGRSWISMGDPEYKDEQLRKKKVNQFIPYQVNKDLVQHAKKDYYFMHCLPAYRDFEVASDIIDSPHSLIYPEAHNRLHAQKGVMALLMG